MPCDHPGCKKPATRSDAVWRTAGHLAVGYFCDEHAPATATPFDEEDD